MLKVLKALPVLLCLSAAPAVAMDPMFPFHGNPNIDVKHYSIDMFINSDFKLDANASIDIVPTSNIYSFTLDLHGLTVRSVKIAGKKVKFTRSGDKLYISATKLLKKGTKYRVAISYKGKPETIQDPTAPADPKLRLGWTKDGDSSYVVSEPVGAGTFFPANDDVSDRATFDFYLMVPKKYVAAANGKLLRTRDFDNKRSYEFEMTEPMTAWNAAIFVNRFKVTKLKSDSKVPIRILSPLQTPDKLLAPYQKTDDMMDFFEGKFGDYPYETYASVIVDDEVLGYALETQTIPLFPERSPDEATVAHELAHQWFGNAVAVKSWSDLWLAEGFATYCEVLWTHRDSVSGFRKAMRAIYKDVIFNDIGPAVVNRPEDLFSDRTYLRGATTLYALDLEIGHTKTVALLGEWFKTYKHETVDSQTFIDFVVKETGKASLRALLESWIYDTTPPVIPKISRSELDSIGPRAKTLSYDLKAAQRP